MNNETDALVVDIQQWLDDAHQAALESGANDHRLLVGRARALFEGFLIQERLARMSAAVDKAWSPPAALPTNEVTA
jgi:hypothetical protein